MSEYFPTEWFTTILLVEWSVIWQQLKFKVESYEIIHHLRHKISDKRCVCYPFTYLTKKNILEYFFHSSFRNISKFINCIHSTTCKHLMQNVATSKNVGYAKYFSLHYIGCMFLSISLQHSLQLPTLWRSYYSRKHHQCRWLWAHQIFYLHWNFIDIQTEFYENKFARFDSRTWW